MGYKTKPNSDELAELGLLSAFSEEHKMYVGITATVKVVLNRTNHAYNKSFQAQQLYFNSIGIPTDNEYTQRCAELITNALVKYQYGVMMTEQLQAIKIISAIKAISRNKGEEDLDTLAGNEEIKIENLTNIILFENALFQWRSFLDFYMKYLIYFLCKEEVDRIKVKIFYQKLSTVNTNKSRKIIEYFAKKIFNKSNSAWGSELDALRNIVTLEDILKPEMSLVDSIGRVKRLRQTIGNKELVEFVQDVENACFWMLTELCPILYERKWYTGPFISK